MWSGISVNGPGSGRERNTRRELEIQYHIQFSTRPCTSVDLTSHIAADGQDNKCTGAREPKWVFEIFSFMFFRVLKLTSVTLVSL